MTCYFTFLFFLNTWKTRTTIEQLESSGKMGHQPPPAPSNARTNARWHSTNCCVCLSPCRSCRRSYSIDGQHQAVATWIKGSPCSWYAVRCIESNMPKSKNDVMPTVNGNDPNKVEACGSIGLYWFPFGIFSVKRPMCTVLLRSFKHVFRVVGSYSTRGLHCGLHMKQLWAPKTAEEPQEILQNTLPSSLPHKLLLIGFDRYFPAENPIDIHHAGLTSPCLACGLRNLHRSTSKSSMFLSSLLRPKLGMRGNQTSGRGARNHNDKVLAYISTYLICKKNINLEYI